MMLSGCSSDDAPVAVITPDDGTTITASDYVMTLDVNKSVVSSSWKTNAITTGVSASVTTQGLYGNCVINDTSITYTKTSESDITDFCIVSIDNSVDINVSINALYWKRVSAGSFHTVALKSDGTIWAWGYNAEGQFGNNSTISSEIPVQESTNATNWGSVSTGYQHTTAIKTDGTIWAWGSNIDGQLGVGDFTSSLIPVQENTNATNWSSVSAGDSHTVALKTDGTIWSWGFNSDGQLGDNSTTTSQIPVQEDSNTTSWSSVDTGGDHTVAIKSDGTLWAWGRNNYGQLGDNSIVQSLIPVQENSLATNWDSVSAGNYHTTALKSNGTLWAWGYNGAGQVGDNTTTQRLIPTQENSLATNWDSTSTGYTHTMAIKSDGTLWAWGENADGQFGNNSSINSQVPILPITRQ